MWAISLICWTELKRERRRERRESLGHFLGGSGVINCKDRVKIKSHLASLLSTKGQEFK